MIDASVGGKVGVNLPEGKNLVGSFYQPSLVIADVTCLKTLENTKLKCGMAESIKHAMLSGFEFVSWLEKSRDKIMQRDPDTLVELVARNVSVKSSIVTLDERESGRRAWLNLGHTFAHAIEVTSGYSVLSHGEAVSLGLVAAGILAARRNLWPFECSQRIEELLNFFDLPTRADIKPDEDLFSAMTHDKKINQKKLRIILPKSCAIGRSCAVNSCHTSSSSLEHYGHVEVFDDVTKEEISFATDYIRTKRS